MSAQTSGNRRRRGRAHPVRAVNRIGTGRPVQIEDALIGGMVTAYRAALATRDTADFDG